MKPPWFVTVGLMYVVLIPAALWSAGHANADEVDVYTTWKAANICSWFQTHPQVSAVEPMFNAIQGDTGFTGEDTARVLVDAVLINCPRFMPLLDAYANSETLAPQPVQRTPVSGGIGGVLR